MTPNGGKVGFWRDEGFTFIELIMVICIIGLLAAIANSSYVDMAQKAKRSACLQNQTYIETAASIGYAETAAKPGGKGQYPTSIQEMVDRKLIDRYPKCPLGGNYNDYDPSLGLAHCSLAEHAR